MRARVNKSRRGWAGRVFRARQGHIRFQRRKQLPMVGIREGGGGVRLEVVEQTVGLLARDRVRVRVRVGLG